MPLGVVPFPFGRCRICKDRATGLHYGVATCEGCKGFFKRSLGKSHTFYCVNDGQCDLSPASRSRCKACRFKRCLDTGMSVNAVRMGRIPDMEKEKVMSVFKSGGSETDGHEIVMTQKNGEFTFEVNQTSGTPTGREPQQLDRNPEGQKFCQQTMMFSGPLDPVLVRWRNQNQYHPPANRMKKSTERFFKRNIGKSHTICVNNGQCDLSPANRSRCKACCFKRWLDTGMSVNAVRTGLIHELEKEKVMSVFKRGGPDTDGHEIAVTQRNGEFSLEMNQTSETPTGSEPLSLDSHTENRKFCQPAGVFSGPSNPTAIRWRNKNQFHPPADQMVNNKASHKVKHPLEKVDTTQAMISNAYPTHAVQYSLQFRNGFGQRQLYPWEQQRSAGSGHVTNSTLFYNWPENNEHSRYRAPGSNGNAMTTFSENNVPLDETRVSFSSQPSANAYGFCNNNDFLNANSQIQTAVDDIIQYPTQNELGITRRQGELAFTANMLDLDNRKSWRGFSSLNAFPDMDTLIPDYKRTISDDGWVAAAYPGQRTQDNLEQIISPETCRRSQSRSPYSPEMIQMLIDQVVETNNSKKVIQEIKKITDPIKDQDIVENIVSKLQEATLKRKYSCDKPTVSTNNSNDTADNEMGTYNGHTCPESATSSPETELRGAPACGPKDNCVMLIADSDAAYERFPDIVDRHNLNTAKVLATFGEIRLGMAILDREKADHRQKIQLHHAGKTRLKITSDSEEDVRITYKKIIDGLPFINERFIGFFNSLSAFNTITQNDRTVLAKRAYYDVWMLNQAEYLVDGESMLFLYTGEVYGTATMRKIIDQTIMDTLFRFADQFNAIGLTDLEIAALCAVRLTVAGDTTLDDRPTVDRVRREFEDALIHALKSEHSESANQLLDDINRLLPLLEETNRVQRNIIAKFPVNYDKTNTN